MRKCICLAVILALLLCSCTQIDTTLPEVTAVTTEDSTTIATLKTVIQLPNPLPLPDSIKPLEHPYHYESDEIMTFRECYYHIPGVFWRLVEPNRPDPTWVANEMLLATYVKYHNIAKEDFIEAVQQEYEWIVENGYDIYSEGDELPNADIIYTFDNEIINAYYRRENPVVPEEYRTYESYEEYLRANP